MTTVPLTRDTLGLVVAHLTKLDKAGVHIFRHVGGDSLTTEVPCRTCKPSLHKVLKKLVLEGGLGSVLADFLLHLHMDYEQALKCRYLQQCS